MIMTSLTGREAKTIYDTIRRVEAVKDKEVEELSDLFTEKPRLIISPTDKCYGACTHCVANSTLKGKAMPYDKFAKIDPEFFEIFFAADFGRRGNPLEYYSNGNDLANVLDHLLVNGGIEKFTLALAVQNSSTPTLMGLQKFVEYGRASIDTMITYHHYFEDLNPVKLAEDFNFALKNYMKFSKKITISLLGDKFSQSNPTKAEEVQKTFNDNWDIIFKDIELTKKDDKNYRASYKSLNKCTMADLYIPTIDTRVYPLGRFRNYLAQRMVLQQYTEKFEQSLSDYACPDLIKWPGIIIEPNGDLNLCASFEAVNCKGAVVTNIFNRSYEQVQNDLIKFHQKEMRWFIDNLSDIIDGKVSTCKLKNNCYQSTNDKN